MDHVLIPMCSMMLHAPLEVLSSSFLGLCLCPNPFWDRGNSDTAALLHIALYTVFLWLHIAVQNHLIALIFSKRNASNKIQNPKLRTSMQHPASIEQALFPPSQHGKNIAPSSSGRRQTPRGSQAAASSSLPRPSHVMLCLRNANGNECHVCMNRRILLG